MRRSSFGLRHTVKCRPTCWLLGALVGLLLREAPEVRAADSSRWASERSWAQHIDRCLRAYEQRDRAGGVDAYEALRPLVRLDASPVEFREGRLIWLCLRQRRLKPDERTRVAEGLESLLRRILSQEPMSDTGRPPLAPSDVDRILETSTLGVRWQPTLRIASQSDVRGAVAGYLRQLEQDPEQGRALREFLQAARLDPQRLHFLGRELVWEIQPAGKIAERVKELREKQSSPTGQRLGGRGRIADSTAEPLNRLNAQWQRLVEQHRPMIESLVRTALQRFPDPRLGAPLFDPETCRDLKIDVEAEDFGIRYVRTMAREPVTNRLRPSPSKGAARRVVEKVFPLDLRIDTLKNRDLIESPFESPPTSLAPELVVDAQGFIGGVNAVAFSPDGSLLAAAGDVVRVWDLATGRLRETLRGERGYGGAGGCTDLAFSPDGRFLVVAASGFQQDLRIYDARDFGEIEETFSAHLGLIDHVALSPDGNWLLTSGADSLCVWDWRTRREVRRYALPRPLDHLGFPGRQSWALAVDIAGGCAAVDLSDLRMAAPPAVPDGSTLRDLVLRPDRKMSASDGRNRVVGFLQNPSRWPDGGRPHPFALWMDLDHDFFLVGGIGPGTGGSRYWCGVWSFAEPQARRTFTIPYYATACAASLDRRRVAVADALGRIHVWNAADGAKQHTFAPQRTPVYSVAFEAGNSLLRFGRKPYPIGQGWGWNRYGPLDHSFDFGDRAVRVVAEQEPPAAATRQNGREMEVLDPGSGAIELVVRGNGRPERRLPFASATQQSPLCFAFLRGSETGVEDAIALGGEDGSLACLDPATLMPRRTMIGHSDRVWCVHQSSDGRYLASGSGDGTIRIWGLRPGAGRGSLAACADDDGVLYHVFPGTPTAASLVPGDRVLAIDGHRLAHWVDQVVQTGRWPWKPGQRVDVECQRGPTRQTASIVLSDMGDMALPLLSLFVSPDARDWVLWTPQGYYDASPQGDRYLGWHVNRGESQAAVFCRAEQYRQRFYRPDVIARVLGAGSVDEAVRAADADRPRPEKPDEPLVLRIPEVRLIEPVPQLRTGAAEIAVVAEIRMAAGPAGRRTDEARKPDVRAVVNGKAVPISDVRQSDGEDDTGRWVARCVVGLERGENQIVVLAAAGGAWSESASVSVTRRPSIAPAEGPRLLVASIGIGRYADPRFNLDVADSDAQDFAAAWKSQEGGLYRSVTARVVTNEEATVAKTLEAMQWLVDSAASEDLAVLFLAGHGVRDANHNYYLATHEVNAQRLRSTALNWSAILQTVQDLRARRCLVFVDTCHAGGLAEVSNVVVDRLRDVSKDDVGAVLFAACSPQARSMENAAWGHGAFTKALLDTFASPDSDRDRPPDGLLSLTDLAHNLDARVRELTKGQQVPVVGIPATLKNFNLFRLPSQSRSRDDRRSEHDGSP